MNSFLECRQLECGYPDRGVLKGVDTSFEPGTSTAIIGPNGSGKTTLLKTLSADLKPIRGSIRIGDQDIASLSVSEIAKIIAFVPQQEHIPFRFTAWEVAMMGRIVRSAGLWDSPEDRAAVTDALQKTDAIGYADRPINELSGGERQRVLLARAIAQDTPIIVLDEPTTHLDITHQIDLCRMARELANAGKLVISAMHDLNIVGLMADRVILIGAGAIRLAGSTEEVLRSKKLDEVYGVAFQRIENGGRTVVLPPFASLESLTS
ncbi:MAG: ABC transporter ATP-binding protein [Chlorobia bacterium]|nr:ABC transporter ATP-binding protein [Fimbriimonadaceae bacterium]